MEVVDNQAHTLTNQEDAKMSLDFIAHENEPAYRPKVHKIMVKQYGLRKFVRVERRKAAA